ncbi:MAG: hypothetical protein U1E42_14495 [Rhodospirillales bacterium]
MKITSRNEYAEAIEQANRLRAQGHSAEQSEHLATLDAAIQAYEHPSHQPGTSPGKPTADPYGKG